LKLADWTHNDICLPNGQQTFGQMFEIWNRIWPFFIAITPQRWNWWFPVLRFRSALHCGYSGITTSFARLSCEDEVRDEKALVRAGHVTTKYGYIWQLLVKEWRDILTACIDWNIQVFETNFKTAKRNASQSILIFMFIATFGTNQLKSLNTPSMFSNIYGIYLYFWRFSTTVTGKAKGTTVSQHDFQAASRRLQVVIHTKFAYSGLEQYGYCL
jgi:hypothetical protein